MKKTDRKSFEQKLIQTADVYRVTSSVTANYEKIGSESLVASDVECYAGNPTGRMRLDSFGIDPMRARIFYFKHDQDVQERDIIVQGSRRFLVRVTDKPGPGDHHLEAITETVSGG